MGMQSANQNEQRSIDKEPDNLRRLQALNVAGLKLSAPESPPQLVTLKILQLRVNADYQRQLSKESVTLIRRIAENWSWKKFRPPVVTPIPYFDQLTGLPLYEVLDGQHTATGAVTNRHLRELPCWVVETRDLVERAEIFVGLNTERIHVTPLVTFWAEVASGKEEALDVLAACEASGASVIRRPPPYGDYAIGETIAVTPLKQIARQGGVAYLKRVLDVAVAAELAPIGQQWIKALELLLLKTNSPFKLAGDYQVVGNAIALTIRRVGAELLLTNATLEHRSRVGNERHSLYWYLAQQIYNETMRG